MRGRRGRVLSFLVRLAPGGDRPLSLGLLDLLRELLHLCDGRVQLVLQLLVGPRRVEAVLRGGRPQSGLHGGADGQAAPGSLKLFIDEIGDTDTWRTVACKGGSKMR